MPGRPLSDAGGRPGGNRTPNPRFWRPVLCQLSYWPVHFLVSRRGLLRPTPRCGDACSRPTQPSRGNTSAPFQARNLTTIRRFSTLVLRVRRQFGSTCPSLFFVVQLRVYSRCTPTKMSRMFSGHSNQSAWSETRRARLLDDVGDGARPDRAAAFANREAQPFSIAIGVISSTPSPRCHPASPSPSRPAASHARHVRRPEVELRTVAVEERRVTAALVLRQDVDLAP